MIALDILGGIKDWLIQQAVGQATGQFTSTVSKLPVGIALLIAGVVMLLLAKFSKLIAVFGAGIIIVGVMLMIGVI